jgi:heme-degrading monooxygenase HmoA|tara:strand:+ start:43 stop:726 length:684 start_codon:yes stop_codon:yes gene_type:complete
MQAITSVTFFSFTKNKIWAFKQMGIAPFRMNSIKGLQFYRFLGTGGGKGFSLWPDFSTYAFLGVWESEIAYINFKKTHPVFLDYQKRATTQRDLVLDSLKSHGNWGGINPFPQRDSSEVEEKSDRQAVVITRATLHWKRLLSFWRAVPSASNAIQGAKGILYYKGIGEWPFIQQATLSIWDDFEAVNAFAYKGKQHAAIIKKTRQKKWYKEDLFSRFHLISDIYKDL